MFKTSDYRNTRVTMTFDAFDASAEEVINTVLEERRLPTCGAVRAMTIKETRTVVCVLNPPRRLSENGVMAPQYLDIVGKHA